MLQAEASGWLENSVHRPSPRPKRQRNGAGGRGRRRESLVLNVFLLKLCSVENLESSGSYRVKGHGTTPGRQEQGAEAPLLNLGLSRGRQDQPLESGTFDGSASLSSPGSRTARRKAWGEHKAYCPHHPACHLACNVRMHCVSRNLECPVLSVGNRLAVQLLPSLLGKNLGALG